MTPRDYGKLAWLAGGAVVFAMVLAHSRVALAQDAAPKSTPDAAPRADDVAPRVADAPKPESRMRTTRTGSNIARVRNEESLPLMTIDRTYIDRTGAATTPELLRTIPQLQLGR